MTAGRAEPAEGARQVVESTKWDRDDFEEMSQAIDQVGKTIEDLREKNWTAPRVMADTFTGLNRAAPRLLDEAEIAPSYRVNRQVMEALEGEESWSKLRSFTIGDKLASTLACTQLGPKLAELYERLAPVQDAADDLQEATDRLDAAGTSADDEQGDEAGGEATPTLEQLRADVEAATAAYDAAADRAAPSVRRAVRSMVNEAVEQTEGTAQAMAGWGFDAGDVAALDPSSRLDLMRQMNTPRMREIAKLFGAIRNTAWGARDSRWDAGPDEVHDVTLGDDLARLTSNEMVSLAVPELEDGFYERFVTKRLECYELRSMVREDQGRIIYPEDSSLTMRGDRELWARAFGLALLQIAHDQRRGFTAIVFAGPNDELQVFDFPSPAEFTPARVIAYASCSIMGGTDFVKPLTAATDLLITDYETHGRSTGDIVFATDGEADVPSDWLANHLERKSTAGFQTWGLQIGGPPSDAMESLSDRHVRIERLFDGADAGAVLTGLWGTVERRRTTDGQTPRVTAMELSR